MIINDWSFLLDEDFFFCMLHLDKSKTGLPVNVLVDTSLAYNLWELGEVFLLFQSDKEESPSHGSFALMTVSSNPEVVGGHMLSEDEIQTIKDFVLKNKFTLCALADMEIGVEDFIPLMKKQGWYK